MAKADDSMNVAMQLGALLAGEDACHLTYDGDAIRAYIAKHVRPDDMEFGTMLDTMVGGQRIEIRNMGRSELIAFCTQTERAAKANGFMSPQ